MDKLLELAIEIAIKAHKGSVDKQDKIYILHPIRVMVSVEAIEEKIVAILHDVVEDTDITFEDLVTYGFPSTIIDALKYLTRDEFTYLYPTCLNNNDVLKTTTDILSMREKFSVDDILLKKIARLRILRSIVFPITRRACMKILKNKLLRTKII